jgi:5'-3' exonuclease
MGVRNLTALLRRYAPEALAERRAHQYRAWPVAIDATLFMHRFVYANRLEQPYPHVEGFYDLCRHLRAWKMRPVFVFDGEERAEAKARESERRGRLKEQAERELLFARQRATRLEKLSYAISHLERLDDQQRLQWTSETQKKWQHITGQTLDIPLVEPDDTVRLASEDHAALDLVHQAMYEFHHTPRSVTDLEKVKEEEEEEEEALEAELKGLVEKEHRKRTISGTEKGPLRDTRTLKFLNQTEKRLIEGLVRPLRMRDGSGYTRGSFTVHGLRKLLDTAVNENHNVRVSLEKRVAYITADFVADVKHLIDLMGYIHISSESSEAEAMCASLIQAGVARATISEDTDAAAFGDHILLRNFCTKTRPILEMNFAVARKALGMTRDQFIDMCILCGTDFSSTLEGIGPIRSVALIQKYGSIEEILKALSDKHPPREGFDAEQARRVFKTLPPPPSFLLAEKTIPVDVEDPDLGEFLASFEIEKVEEPDNTAYYDADMQAFEGLGPNPFADQVHIDQ